MYRSRTGNRTSLLYHRRVSRLTGGTTRKLLAGLAMLGTAAFLTDRLDAAGPVDRLDQFRTLARARSMANGAADSSPDAYREMYALLDEEIVESLGTGGLYASTAFLQDRLHAFGEAWGAAAVAVLRLVRLMDGAHLLGARRRDPRALRARLSRSHTRLRGADRSRGRVPHLAAERHARASVRPRAQRLAPRAARDRGPALRRAGCG